MIYERKAKDVSVEKKKEVLTALWDATSGLGEVTCTLFNVVDVFVHLKYFYIQLYCYTSIINLNYTVSCTLLFLPLLLI